MKAWLSRILHNLFISEYRRKQAKSYAEPTDLNEMNFMDETAEGVIPELEEMDPGELLYNDEFLQSIDQRLKQGLEEMSDTYRDAFLLNAIGGLRYREVARKLKVPLGTVMSRLHRAKTTMREAWIQPV
jgi:RNA polymerase sigma-70 factor (ECF subfamily)